METYTNRKGQTYYLKVAVTKTGTPRYYAATDPKKGKNGETMPAGYTFHENVNGVVSVGKPKATPITEAEIALIKSAIRKLKVDCRFEIKGKRIVLYTTDDPNFPTLAKLLGSARAEDHKKQHVLYQPMLRFSLIQKDERLFQAERMCFRGEPDWIWIAEPGPLKRLAQKIIPLLDDKEALFEKFY